MNAVLAFNVKLGRICLALQHLFYPNLCALCHSHWAIPQWGYVCEDCRSKLDPLTFPFCEVCGHMGPVNLEKSISFKCSQCTLVHPGFDYARAAVKTNPLILEVVHKFKYSQKVYLKNFLGSLLNQAADRWIKRKDWDMIIPIPLHSAHQRKRGFNQAECLARILSKHTKIPLHLNNLQRVKNTLPQACLERNDRLKNLKGAFNVKDKELIRGSRIILVDDILTTGTTCDYASRVLKKAGADYICVLTVSRGVYH